MEFLQPGHFSETIADKILGELGINIDTPEYSETCFSVNNVNRPEQDNPYYEIYQGIIGIYRNEFLLYWLVYTYSYDKETGKDDCEITIVESFPENLELFNGC